MDNIKLFITCAVILLFVPRSLQQHNAKDLPWSQWAEGLVFAHIVELNQYLIFDVTYKLRHAEKVQEKHKHSITFELGTITAGILDNFKDMLVTYRWYAKIDAFRHQHHGARTYMHVFHRIQGKYNEIRMEIGMFHNIVRDYEATIGSTTKFTFPYGFSLPFRSARRFVNDANGSVIYLTDNIKSTTKQIRKRPKMLLPWKEPKKSLWKPAW